MPNGDASLTDILGIVLVLVLVAANGFFVAAEFPLVAVRRSRVAELVASGRMNATILRRAVNNLDTYLAATQHGITISSLALGWVGEPALVLSRTRRLRVQINKTDRTRCKRSEPILPHRSGTALFMSIEVHGAFDRAAVEQSTGINCHREFACDRDRD